MSVARCARATKTTKISTLNMFVARVAAGTSVTAGIDFAKDENVFRRTREPCRAERELAYDAVPLSMAR